MKSALLVKPGKIEIKETESPLPGPGELVIQVQCALTCGTTLKAFERGHPKIKMPGPFGHEFSGIVDRAGEGSPFAPGERVVCLHTWPCKRCRFCLRGRPNLCSDFGNRVNFGAYSEKIRIPAELAETYCFSIPPHVSFLRASFLQSLSCVVHAWNLMAPKDGESVCILGTGSFAALFGLLGREKGFRPVLLGRNPRKCEDLRKRGFLCEDSVEKAKSHWNGTSPQTVFEAVGSAEAWTQALEMVDAGGRVLWFGGLPGSAEVRLDHHKAHYSEISILGAFHYTPKDVAEAKTLLFEKIDPTFLVSGRFPLENLEEAFLHMKEGKGQKYEIVP